MKVLKRGRSVINVEKKCKTVFGEVRYGNYKEAGPQLLLQAFLQRIINGGGRISREYGLGRKRTDLFIEWPVSETEDYYGEVQRMVLELKILHKSLEATLDEGLAQTAAPRAKCFGSIGPGMST